MLEKAIRQALDEAELEKEYLPEEIRHKYNLAEYNYAIEEIHFPKDDHSMRLARHRLVFDEFLLFILAVRNLKEGREKIRPSFLTGKKGRDPEDHRKPSLHSDRGPAEESGRNWRQT